MAKRPELERLIMHIELKEIDKDTLKVGDVVGVMRTVQAGWRCGFRHALITHSGKNHKNYSEADKVCHR